MKSLTTLISLLTVCMFSAVGQTAPSAGATGGGPYTVPDAAAYAILDNAANTIFSNNKNYFSGPIIIYDSATFGLIPQYESAVQHLHKTLASMCPVPPAGEHPQIALGPVDVGSAASGLAALVTAFTPAYTIQGQALTFKNSALVAAFAHQAGGKVVFPAYLLPPSKTKDLTCDESPGSSSLVDLWSAAAAQAAELRHQIANNTGTTQAGKDKSAALQKKLDAYSTVAETYLAVDKGASLLSRLLVVESLTRFATDAGATVIDLDLDAVGMESTTRTWIGFKKTSFACNVAAHYTILQFTEHKPEAIALTPLKTDLVNILLKVPDQDKFGSSVSPMGLINGNAVKPR